MRSIKNLEYELKEEERIPYRLFDQKLRKALWVIEGVPDTLLIIIFLSIGYFQSSIEGLWLLVYPLMLILGPVTQFLAYKKGAAFIRNYVIEENLEGTELGHLILNKVCPSQRKSAIIDGVITTLAVVVLVVIQFMYY